MLPTKAEAWQKRSDEVRIKLKDDYPYHFTRQWFRNRNMTTWSSFLPRRFPADQPHRMIQIGVFEGMDLVWCFQNILCHPKSSALAIDPWVATTKLDADYMEGVYARAQHNLRKYRDRLTIERGYSGAVLESLLVNKSAHNSVDLIVIDGDHNAPGVLNDANLALQLAKPGGWLLFDDYHNDIHKVDHVQKGVADFLELHGDEVNFEWAHRYCVCFSKK